MIEIPLTQNQTTYIDDIDSDLADLRWCAASEPTYADGSGFRAQRKIKNNGTWSTQYLHRIVLSRIIDRTLASNEVVDHLNGNPLDNRRNNLRLSTTSQNGCNRPYQSNNVSGYKGVSWISGKQKWKASITSNKKNSFLGYYDDPVEAAKSYDKAALELHGEFAFLNFSP